MTSSWNPSFKSIVDFLPPALPAGDLSLLEEKNTSQTLPRCPPTLMELLQMATESTPTATVPCTMAQAVRPSAPSLPMPTDGRAWSAPTPRYRLFGHHCYFEGIRELSSIKSLMECHASMQESPQVIQQRLEWGHQIKQTGVSVPEPTSNALFLRVHKRHLLVHASTT